MSNTMYQIFMLLISLLGVILTGLIVPWLKIKIGKEKMSQVQMWVNVAVAAAEQIFSMPGAGIQKKVYVIEFLKSKGITITEQELDALIEAAVYELNRAKFLMFEDMENQDVEPG
jgi:hypothetical protein